MAVSALTRPVRSTPWLAAAEAASAVAVAFPSISRVVRLTTKRFPCFFLMASMSATRLAASAQRPCRVCG